MTRQEGNWWLVQTSSRINVDGIDNVVRLVSLRHAVLTSWRKQKASIGRKGEPSEEAWKSFASINIGLSHAQAHSYAIAWPRRIGHDGRQG
jgi:hypothetical protein